MKHAWPTSLGNKKIRLLESEPSNLLFFHTEERSRQKDNLRRFPQPLTGISPLRAARPWWLRPEENEFDPPPPDAA